MAQGHQGLTTLLRMVEPIDKELVNRNRDSDGMEPRKSCFCDSIWFPLSP
jgi:hypothetical protein